MAKKIIRAYFTDGKDYEVGRGDLTDKDVDKIQEKIMQFGYEYRPGPNTKIYYPAYSLVKFIVITASGADDK